MADLKPTLESYAALRRSDRGASVSGLEAGFAEREQELATIGTRATLTGIISPVDAAKFQLELHNYHMLHAETVARHLGSSLGSGLQEAEAAARLAAHGPNEVRPPRPTAVWVKALRALASGFNGLLWVAILFALLAYKPFGSPPSDVYALVLALVLVAVVILSAGFTLAQEVASSAAVSGFGRLVPAMCIVLRGGMPRRLPTSQLVVGDVVQLGVGQRVPADMRVAQAAALQVDKSVLTGESEPVRVVAAPATPAQREPTGGGSVGGGGVSTSMLTAPNMVFMGTSVSEGSGTGIVIATGADNQIAKIAALASSPPGVTSLQAELNRFVGIIATLSLVMGSAVILTWGLWLRTTYPTFMPLAAAVSNTISVVVAFVPEGLPLALAMALTLIARRLCAESGVLVKALGTVETLGSVSLVCSDKTGTLTTGVMTVTSLVGVSPMGCGPAGDPAIDCAARVTSVNAGEGTEAGVDMTAATPPEPLPPVVEALLRVGVLCNAARLEAPRPPSRRGSTVSEASVSTAGRSSVAVEVGGTAAIGGNGVDRALLEWATSRLPHDGVSSLRGSHTALAVVPFSSSTKLACGVWQRHDREAESRVFVAVKGAPEMVLARCSSVLDGCTGQVTALSPATRAALTAAVDAASARGQRLVALAQLDLPLGATAPGGAPFTAEPTPNFPLEGLVYVGAVAVSDPPRPAVRGAVGTLREAGIKVAMVTGDAASTAKAIAADVGIISGGGNDGNQGAPDTLSAAGFGRPAEAAPLPMLMAAFTPISSPPPAASLPSPASALAVFSSQAIVVSGSELVALSQEGWDFIFAHDELVFARTTPEQKLEIVRQARARGYRVGVTGDGVNDAPALKAADVGIAMGGGSDVARDVASLVLQGDDFAAVVGGVREGRLVFSNLRKVVAYQIAGGCWSELLPVLATFWVGMPQPLSSFLMIIISCVTDVGAGVALSYERAESDIMLRPPRDVRRSRLVTAALVAYSYLFYGSLQSMAAFVTFLSYMASRGPTGALPTPLQASADPTDPRITFPAGYTPAQLIGAWAWGADNPGGPLGADQASALATGSSIYFLVLVVTQMGHLLSVRTRLPYFHGLAGARSWDEATRMLRAGLGVRLPILASWVWSIAVVLLFNEVPTLQVACGTAHIPGVYWGVAVAWSVALFLVAECRKWALYAAGPTSWWGRALAW